MQQKEKVMKAQKLNKYGWTKLQTLKIMKKKMMITYLSTSFTSVTIPQYYSKVVLIINKIIIIDMCVKFIITNKVL